MPARGDNSRTRVSTGPRRGRTLGVVGAIAAAVLVGLGTGVVPLPGGHGAAQGAQTSARTALAARQRAADEQWAAATCTDILDWKNEIKRDGTSLNLSFGALTRVHDALGATTGMLDQLSKLGLPPGAHTPHARAQTDQLRSDIESRVHTIQSVVASIASGNLAAIGTLVSDLRDDTAMEPQIVNQLRNVVSVDLGLSLVETRACRQLVGIPI